MPWMLMDQVKGNLVANNSGRRYTQHDLWTAARRYASTADGELLHLLLQQACQGAVKILQGCAALYRQVAGRSRWLKTKTLDHSRIPVQC